MLADPFTYCRQHLALDAAVEALAKLDDARVLAARIQGELQAHAQTGALAGEAASRLISALNDRLTVRIIALVAQRHRLPPVSWCWLALGSEGRHEQTFVTDQDNGLIFNAASGQEADALRQIYVPFAQDVNQQLAACGFSLCTGEIMAGNPAWCLSLDEWREQFIDWVRRPEPRALLNASIFFDLRPLYGDTSLGENLRTLFLSMTTATPSFQHLMAANALHADVPLGLLGDVVVDGKDALDLKKFGSRIFVDAARIFALSTGTRAVSTVERLAEAGKMIGLPASEIATVNAAFGHILRLRLEHQVGSDRAQGSTAIKPALLNDMDRAILKEALKQARRLQQRLKLNYSL